MLHVVTCLQGVGINREGEGKESDQERLVEHCETGGVDNENERVCCESLKL